VALRSPANEHFEQDEPPESRLYLKTDDHWNISHSIVAFREIAEQMASVNSPQDARMARDVDSAAKQSVCGFSLDHPAMVYYSIDTNWRLQ
jgi:hypothetical protein